jgi:hypothetical protein
MLIMVLMMIVSGICGGLEVTISNMLSFKRRLQLPSDPVVAAIGEGETDVCHMAIYNVCPAINRNLKTRCDPTNNCSQSMVCFLSQLLFCVSQLSPSPAAISQMLPVNT